MSKKTETLQEIVNREPDFHSSEEFIIIAVKKGSNEVWHSHQGNPMHLIQVLETSHESLKKEVIKGMLAKLSKMIDDEENEDDDPLKMELAKAEAIQALKNITKH